MNDLIIDGCAGPGGWSEGMRHHLGLHDVGLEWDTAACKTRAAAGHATIQCDVSQYPVEPFIGKTKGLVFSPPCTLFSEGGTRIGRLVIGLLAEGIRRLMRGEDCRQEIRDGVYPIALEAQRQRNAKRVEGKRWDDGRVESAAREDAFIACLVLEPARYLYALIAGGEPFEWTALEQVPSVLPLWNVYVQELQRLGWSAWAGVLCAADYGVGQVRNRAVLIASAVRKVQPPEPTHAEDGGAWDLFGGCRMPWRTMADTLGWGATDRPSPTVTAGGAKTGGVEPFARGGREALHNAQERSAWSVRTAFGTPSADRRNGSHEIDPFDRPAHTVTSKTKDWALRRPSTTVQATNRTAPPGHRDRAGGEHQFGPETIRITVAEAGLLQSFPADYPWQGTRNKQHEQAGNAVPPLLAAHVVSAASGIPMRQEAAA